MYTQDLQAKIINAHCPPYLAPDPDLHWICKCPCPALKEHRNTLLHETFSAHFRQLLAHTENNRNTSFRNCLIYAEPSVLVSATARIANSFGREPG
jgi:hypothetical protein